jgi:tetratricopeptide (TPR) repeat protein
MDEITGVLVDGSLEVADRNNLAYVYKELGFQMSADVSDEGAQAIGKFLGAAYVITGQLVNLGDAWRFRLNGINVETAIHESSTGLDVRNDRDFERRFAALRDAAPAVRAARRGEGKAPATAGTFLDRGITFAVRGDYDMAIEDFTQALELDPNLAAAWMLRGRAVYAGASRVIGLGGNFGSVRTVTTIGQAVSAARLAAYDKAIADFTQAIRLDPGSKTAYYERGRAYYSRRDFDKAIADQSQAIRLAPDYAPAYTGRGNVYADKGDYDKALADYSQAIRLAPDYVTAYNNRGAAYYGKGEYQRAGADWEQALRIDPDHATARNNLDLLLRAGR